jgi:hypothetical protein
MLSVFGHGWKVLAQLSAKSALMAAAGGLCGMGARWAAPAGLPWQLAAGAAGVCLAYAAAIRLFDMETFREFRQRI